MKKNKLMCNSFEEKLKIGHHKLKIKKVRDVLYETGTQNYKKK